MEIDFEINAQDSSIFPVIDFSYDKDANTSIKFYGDGGELIGEFKFSDSQATFVGNADESAQLFVDLVLKKYGMKDNKQNINEGI